jgi:hypothetical protein
MRLTAALLTLLALSACANSPAPTGPAGQISATDQNPITGSRGGTGSK